MPAHGKPNPAFRFRAAHEIEALDAHFNLRNVPARSNDTLMLACWNIANFGIQNRSNNAIKLLAHICRRFDLIAVQEVNENWHPLADMVKELGPSCHAREFPKRDVTVNYTYHRVPKSKEFKNLEFEPFDRNPFIGSFACGMLDFTLANCHLYWGAGGNPTNLEKQTKYARRVMEVHALAAWANKRAEKSTTYDQDIILLGDMNVPSMTPLQASYGALIEYGMQPLKYASRGSNLSGKNTYDQMAFAPNRLQGKIIGLCGV
ncbi:hypothetical protein GQR58_002351 [Nymphon striatum]|nr:hypothetical protein GQR58_002351 [Nymphon striatum]